MRATVRATVRATWLRRVGVSAAVWAAICVVAALVGARPRPLVLAAMVIAAAAVVWVSTDLGHDVEPASWSPGYPGYLGGRHDRGADVRVRVLRRTLAEALDDDAFIARVHPILVDLVDDRLDSSYGVTRPEHPGAARTILGPELADFVEHPPPPARARDLQYLSDILSRIESL